MRKDKLISFRVPEPVYDEVCALAEKRGVSVSQLMKDFIVAGSWSIELERNRTYHQQVLKELDKVEKRLARVRVKGLSSPNTKVRTKVKA
jgi:hypothetical protein